MALPAQKVFRPFLSYSLFVYPLDLFISSKMDAHVQFHFLVTCDGLALDKPGRRRKAHRKSRAGCRNCKSRKVKVSNITWRDGSDRFAHISQCDESLPHCTVCLKMGLQCLYGRSSEPPDPPHYGRNSSSLGSPRPIENPSSEQRLELSSTTSDSMPLKVPSRCDETLQGLHSLDVMSIDLPEMSLLRHFDAVTSEFLPYGQMLWREIVATIAFKVRGVKS